MTELFWSDKEHRLGDAVMDKEHQTILILLAAAMQADDASLVNCYQQLTDATTTHLIDENLRMESVGYPALIAHQGEHGTIIELLTKGMQFGIHGELDQLRQLMERLPARMLEHLHGPDTAFADWLSRM